LIFTQVSTALHDSVTALTILSSKVVSHYLTQSSFSPTRISVVVVILLTVLYTTIVQRPSTFTYTEMLHKTTLLEQFACRQVLLLYSWFVKRERAV